MIERKVVINFRCPVPLLDKIESFVKDSNNPKGVFDTVSDVIRESIEVGIKIRDYQEMMKEPKKANEFREKMLNYIKNEEVFDWARTLTTDQIDGYVMALQMEKDQRFKVQKLV